MHIIHDLENFNAPWDSSVITLGVFDGMHRGHQTLVRRLQKRSRRANRARVLVTYHPHPDQVLGKKNSPRPQEIFTYEEKLALLQQFELDAVVFLPFTLELARMTALRYLKDILLGKLKAKHIIIGYDQCFGRGRKGNYKFLKQMSRRYEYKVDRLKAVRYKRKIISSSYIRILLEKGDIRTTNRLLGHSYFACGTVIRGFQRGAELGYPTANLEFSEHKLLPAQGTYACLAEYGAELYRAMVNIGVNPTFGQDTLSVEAHILDFDKTIYGEQVRLYFKERLRDEIKFDSVDELKAQLARDHAGTAKLKLKL